MIYEELFQRSTFRKTIESQSVYASQDADFRLVEYFPEIAKNFNKPAPILDFSVL